MTTAIPHPPIVLRDQWLIERKKLLKDEKELTKQSDCVDATRLQVRAFPGPVPMQALRPLLPFNAALCEFLPELCPIRSPLALKCHQIFGLHARAQRRS